MSKIRQEGFHRQKKRVIPGSIAEAINLAMAKPGGNGLLAELAAVKLVAAATAGTASDDELEILKGIDLKPLNETRHQATPE